MKLVTQKFKKGKSRNNIEDRETTLKDRKVTEVLNNRMKNLIRILLTKFQKLLML